MKELLCCAFHNLPTPFSTQRRICSGEELCHASNMHTHITRVNDNLERKNLGETRVGKLWRGKTHWQDFHHYYMENPTRKKTAENAYDFENKKNQVEVHLFSLKFHTGFNDLETHVFCLRQKSSEFFCEGKMYFNRTIGCNFSCLTRFLVKRTPETSSQPTFSLWKIFYEAPRCWWKKAEILR